MALGIASATTAPYAPHRMQRAQACPHTTQPARPHAASLPSHNPACLQPGLLACLQSGLLPCMPPGLLTFLQPTLLAYLQPSLLATRGGLYYKEKKRGSGCLRSKANHCDLYGPRPKPPARARHSTSTRAKRTMCMRSDTMRSEGSCGP